MESTKRTSKTFVISDTHFGHSNIIRYCHRPFETVEEMTEALIDNWNSVVSNDDEVWHLGDFCCFAKHGLGFDICKRLNGKKYLVLGNHDEYQFDSDMDMYFTMGFSKVYDIPVFYKGQFWMSHRPFKSAYGVDVDKIDGIFNIFGHIHNNGLDFDKYGHKVYLDDITKSTFNVSADVIGYTPIEFDKVVSLMKEYE